MTNTQKPSKSRAEKVSPDWERLEIDYRAGVKTLRQIADEHGVSHTTIRKKAKQKNWDRDLSAKIKQKAELLVSKAEVSNQVSKDDLGNPPVITEAKEREVIEANGQAIANVILGHRKDIRRTMLLVVDMTNALEHMLKPECQEQLEQLGFLLCKPDDKGVDKLNELYNYIISLPSIIKMVKSLSETLRILIDAQRKAFGIDDKFNPNDPANEGFGFHTGKSMSDAERAVRMVRLLTARQHGG